MWLFRRVRGSVTLMKMLVGVAADGWLLQAVPRSRLSFGCDRDVPIALSKVNRSLVLVTRYGSVKKTTYIRSVEDRRIIPFSKVGLEW